MPKMDEKYGRAKPVCITIPEDLLRQLDDLVSAERITRSGVICRLLIKLLNEGVESNAQL